MKTKIFILLIVSYILFIQNLGSIALWDPDEPRQAIIAREMIERSDFINPYLNGEPNRWKPPFFSWMIILASKITGNLDEFSSRIPSAIAATFLMLITFFLGRAMGDPTTGFISGMVLATNFQFLLNARESVMDMTFAFFIGLTIFLAYFAVKKETKWWLAFAFIPASFAVLTKGPAGLLIPACVLFVYLLAIKKAKRFAIPLLCGCFLSAGIASIWFLLVGAQYFTEFILLHNFTRYINAFDHKENLFYYFHKLFFNFLPWSILLPFAVFHAFTRKYWLPLLWFLFTFLFFEVSTSKRAIYLLPLYPASALLCGLYIRDKWSWLAGQSRAHILLAVFAFLLACLPIGAVVALASLQNDVVAILKTSHFVYVFIIILAITGSLFLCATMRRAQKWALTLLFVYLAIVGISYTSYYLPMTDRFYKSPRLITDNLKILAGGKDVFLYGDNSAALIFYIGKPVKILVSVEDLKKYEKYDSILIITDSDAQRIAAELNTLYVPIKKTTYEREPYTLYLRKKFGSGMLTRIGLSGNLL